MNSPVQLLIVNNIKLSISASFEEAFSIARKKLQKLGVSLADAIFSVYRRSIDARKKDNILFVYSISVKNAFTKLSDSALADNNIARISEPTKPDFFIGEEKLAAPPLIVGSGPCGLFAALMLAEAGYNPILIERGGSIKERVSAVDNFNKKRILDSDTNIQFGAGGAGTFSDG